MNELVEKKAAAKLEQGYRNARQILQDEDKLEQFLRKLENKLREIPGIGGRLAAVPLLGSLLNSYVRKEYIDIPVGSIVAIVSALVYFVSPIDFIPDIIPAAGYIDDAAVIAACWTLVESDLKEYTKWRDDRDSVINDRHGTVL